MAPMPPTYDHDISVLIGYYRKALQKITNELERIDLTNFQRSQLLITQKEVADALGDLDVRMKAWVATIVPKAVEDGIIYSIISLGVAETVEQARTILTLSRLNRDFIKTAVADTQDDLLQVSQNVERKVRTAIRQVTAEAMRANLTQGINTTDSIKRDILINLRQQLGDSINTGIIDSIGRRWRPENYVETVVQTKLGQAQRESAINDALSRDAYYGIISAHGAKDACSKWENKVVKLTPDAPGDMPYYGSLPTREIFHVRCRHVISPIRNLDRLPDNIRQNNGIQ